MITVLYTITLVVFGMSVLLTLVRLFDAFISCLKK